MEDAFARDASEVPASRHGSCLCVTAVPRLLTPLLLQVLRLLNVDPGVGLSDAEVVEVGSVLSSGAQHQCNTGNQTAAA